MVFSKGSLFLENGGEGRGGEGRGGEGRGGEGYHSAIAKQGRISNNTVPLHVGFRDTHCSSTGVPHENKTAIRRLIDFQCSIKMNRKENTACQNTSTGQQAATAAS